jgi:hypothetical protein
MKRVFPIYFLLLGILSFISNPTLAQKNKQQAKDSIIHFIFTSDVHFGLEKEIFQGKTNVPAVDVNLAMVRVMNQLKGKEIPKDLGVQSGQVIKGIDALVITGDIANRMEAGVQSATTSWAQFKMVFIDSLRIKNVAQKKASLWVVPGNHDMSNAIGFHRPMEPKKDPASMLGIYNLMFPNTPLQQFDSTLCRIHYSKELKGIHFIFLSLFPDSAERVWMENDLQYVNPTQPVFLFAHSIPNVEPRFFENPNGIHDINEQDKFENLVPERYKDGLNVKGETTLEQNAFVDFLKKHPNIKVYFHGHENYTEYYSYHGPQNDINLQCIRTDSPMKGRFSAKAETKLAFELVSINTKTSKLSVREILWNAAANSNPTTFQWGEQTTIPLQ